MRTRLFANISRRGAAVAVILSLIIGLALPANAGWHRGPFSGITVFGGDSLTDTGNFYALTGFPPAPYYQGRFSNGPVWIEYFARLLRIKLDKIINLALAGATTGRVNENDVPGGPSFGGILDQIDRFLAAHRHGRGVDQQALYVYWGGANDFFMMGDDPNQTIAQAIANTVQAIRKLHAAGARHFMVINLPDLGLTPLGIASGNAAGLSFLSTVYNQHLDQALDQLEDAGIRTIRVDSAAVLQAMVANPDEYDFSNVTQPYLAVGGDPSGFLFWDVVHPTTRGHEVLAEAAVEAVLDHYSSRPRKVKVRGHGQIHSPKWPSHWNCALANRAHKLTAFPRFR